MGKHLVETLVSEGHDVTIATRGITPDNFGKKVKRIVFDRTQVESIKANIPTRVYDVVFDSLADSSNDVKNLLDIVKCKRYIQTSTASVYHNFHLGITEDEFSPKDYPLVYRDYDIGAFGEVKRQAEVAIALDYSHIPAVSVRFPLVLAQDDYTKRMFFYINNLVNKKPMSIDNLDSKIGYVNAREAGQFLAFLGKSDFVGSINGGSFGVVTLREILHYAESKTGITPIFNENGEAGPLNGFPNLSLNVELAKSIGFAFSDVNDWIFELIDDFIILASR